MQLLVLLYADAGRFRVTQGSRINATRYLTQLVS
jgi:hypothetical protein